MANGATSRNRAQFAQIADMPFQFPVFDRTVNGREDNDKQKAVPTAPAPNGF